MKLENLFEIEKIKGSGLGLMVIVDKETATKSGCPDLENAETDRRRQSYRLSQNHRTAGKADRQA